MIFDHIGHDSDRGEAHQFVHVFDDQDVHLGLSPSRPQPLST